MNAPVTIGLVSISDRASAGTYTDEGLPKLETWLEQVLITPWQPLKKLIPDELETISATLVELVDSAACPLVLTTGGTGPAPRDVTPEATLAIADRVMDGFGERMRAASLAFAPTAILSRQVAVIRNRSLIINLPGRPKAIAENLAAVFPAIPYCIDLLGGPRLDTNPAVVVAFRPNVLKPTPI